MKYTSANQYAGMLERRMDELDKLSKRLRAANLPGADKVQEAALKLDHAACALRAFQNGSSTK